MDSDSEPKLISLISQLISFEEDMTDSKMISLMVQAISVVSSMDLESQPKPESELMSLVSQAISVFNSMDLHSQPEPLFELISTFTQKLSIDSDSEAMLDSGSEANMDSDYEANVDSDSEGNLDSELLSLYYETFKLDPRPELISIIPQIVSLFTTTDPEFTPLVAETWRRLKSPESEFMSLLYQILDLAASVSEGDPSEFLPNYMLRISLFSQIISVFSSLELDSQPQPQPHTRIMFVLTDLISVANSISDSEPEWELISLATQFIALIRSIDLEQQTPTEQLLLLINHAASQIYSFKYADTKLVTIVNVLCYLAIHEDSELLSLYYKTFNLNPRPEFISIIPQIVSLFTTTDAETWRLKSPESELMSLLSQLISLKQDTADSGWEFKMLSLVIQVVSDLSSLELESQPKPQTKVMSVLTQTISVANSISDSEPEWEFVSFMTQCIALLRSIDPELQTPQPQLFSLYASAASHLHSLRNADSELYSLINQLLYLAIHEDSEPEEEWELDQLISLSPQLKVLLVQGKFQVTGKVERENKEKGECQPGNRHRLYLAREGDEDHEEATHFLCEDCNGEDHEECKKAPVEVKHPLHLKHSLQLVSQEEMSQARKCFCCEEDLQWIFYYCEACDFAMNIACTDRPPVLSIDHPKWHEHTLSLFPRRAFLTCNVCALADASSPIYMCPPCDFVIHLRCINLPRVIRISRHPYRISFTPSFHQGDWSCGVCRKNIDSDYGGYSCIKDGCSYAAHSRCATQTNVWDGIELDGVPEDIEEEVAEPFLQISDGIIQHCTHQQHHLRLDENTCGDYDDNNECQACITPIYFGKFYSCMQCDFILHEACANLSRKMHHPIHPHLLTLVGGSDGVRKCEDKCSACPRSCIAGLMYQCREEGCSFKLHVQCATVSEPLVQESHKHPLFLTSKAGEQRACSVCRDARLDFTKETFNCIECEFSVCFGCATLPQKVRYKHDKHMLTLSYGEETSTMTYWCEACERKINPKERFYKCDEYCCNTLHIECLIGKDLYMKRGSCFDQEGLEFKVVVLPNNHMSRPLCFGCRNRCPYKIVLQQSLLTFCSIFCLG